MKHSKRLVTLLVFALSLCLLLSFTACGKKDYVVSAETAIAKTQELILSSVESDSIEFSVIREKNGLKLAITNVQSSNFSRISLTVERNELSQKFGTLIIASSDTVYLNLDATINLLEYCGFSLPDTTLYAGRYLALPKTALRFDALRTNALNMTKAFNSAITEALDSVSYEKEIMNDSATGFLSLLTDSSTEIKEALTAFLADANAALYTGENHAEVIRVKDSLLTLFPEMKQHDATPEDPLANVYIDMLAEETTLAREKENYSISVNFEEEENSAYFSLSSSCLDGDESLTSSFSVIAERKEKIEGFEEECSISPSSLLDVKTFLSVLNSNLDKLVNSREESNDFPYVSTIEGDKLIYRQANTLFSEEITYRFSSGQMMDVTASYKTNLPSIHTAIAKRYEYMKIEGSGYVVRQNDAAPLNAGLGQGSLVYTSTSLKDFPALYAKVTSPDELIKIISLSDFPLYMP